MVPRRRCLRTKCVVCWGKRENTVKFTKKLRAVRRSFVRPSGKGGLLEFPVALFAPERYNAKQEIAAPSNRLARFQSGRPQGRREGLMFAVNAVLNSILALDIILVLVRVIPVRKENSVFGHALEEGV